MNPLHPNIGTIPKIRQTEKLRLSYNPWFDKSRKFGCLCGVQDLVDLTNLTEVSRTLALNRRQDWIICVHRCLSALNLRLTDRSNIYARVIVEERRQKAEEKKNFEGNNFAFFPSSFNILRTKVKKTRFLWKSWLFFERVRWRNRVFEIGCVPNKFCLRDDLFLLSPNSYLFIAMDKNHASDWREYLQPQAESRFELDPRLNLDNFLHPRSFPFRLSRVLAAASLCQQKELVFPISAEIYPWRLIYRSRALTLIKISSYPLFPVL